MTKEALNSALVAIQDGRAADVLNDLDTLHKKRPRDISTCYVFAYALEQAGESDGAASVWSSARVLQKTRRRGGVSRPGNSKAFRHTSTLKQDLEAIFFDDSADDPVQELITKLNTGTPSDFMSLDEEDFDDPLPEEEEQQLVSETLGRILIAQEKYSEAASVYRTLAEQHPDHRERLLAEANQLRDLAAKDAEL